MYMFYCSMYVQCMYVCMYLNNKFRKSPQQINLNISIMYFFTLIKFMNYKAPQILSIVFYCFSK